MQQRELNLHEKDTGNKRLQEIYIQRKEKLVKSFKERPEIL
jgi:hypothetical protein